MSSDTFSPLQLKIYAEERAYSFELLRRTYRERFNRELMPEQYADAFVPPADLVARIQSPEKAHPDCWFATSYQTILAYLGELSDHSVDILNCSSVLDFGCGLGRLSVHLQPLCSDVFACDIDDRVIAWAARTFPSIHFARSAFLPPLPYDDVSFDFVFGNSVFTHILYGHQEAWIAEIARITKPGGMAIMSVIDPNVQMSDWGFVAFDKSLVDEKYIEWSFDERTQNVNIYMTGKEQCRLWNRHFSVLEIRSHYNDQCHIVLRKI